MLCQPSADDKDVKETDLQLMKHCVSRTGHDSSTHRG